MKTLFGVLLLAVAAAAAPEGEDRELAAAKEKVQAMLDEAALLEEAGRRDEAARVREEATALKRKIGAAQEGKGSDDDPRVLALKNIEKAIGALKNVECGDLVDQLRGTADRLRADIKDHGLVHEIGDGEDRWSKNLRAGSGKPRGEDADFWRRNIDTLRIAMKGLAEAGRADAADAMERAIHARELLLEGKGEEAARAKSPGDGDLAELLLKAAGCWREFKQPDKAAACEELGRFFQLRVEKRTQEARAKEGSSRVDRREGPLPEDRMARLEERLDRMEWMLHDTLERLAERDRRDEAEREAQRELDRKNERGGR